MFHIPQQCAIHILQGTAPFNPISYIQYTLLVRNPDCFYYVLVLKILLFIQIF